MKGADCLEFKEKMCIKDSSGEDRFITYCKDTDRYIYDVPKNTECETWKLWPKNNMYAVSSNGRVMSRTSGRMLKIQTDKNGYRSYKISKKTVLVHRAVAETFIPNPYNLPEVNHIDEDKGNNKVENLNWSTHIDNCNYGSRNERTAKTKSVRKKQEDQMHMALLKKVKQLETENRMLREKLQMEEIQSLTGDV